MMNEWLATAEEAARAAGQEASRRLAQGLAPQQKSFREWVTEGDIQAQRAALAVIRARYPEHAILAEEEGYTGEAGEDGWWAIPDGPVWVIDPVDGTTNFARHLPFFSVSIGVALDGLPVAGVIFDPVHDDLFSAVRGQGASLNGRPLQLESQNNLGDAVVGFDSPPDPEKRAQQWAIMTRLGASCRTLREFGSAALGMAYVAAGRLDAYLHLDLHPWDVAVGALLVQEAGGVVCQPDGEAWRLGQPSVMMCNPALLDSLVAVVRASKG